MRSKRAPQRPPTRIDDLADGPLLRVLRLVPASCRRTLPLVCRRWRVLLDGPEAWEDVHLDFSWGRVEDSSAMYRWILKRRGAVKRLMLVAETDEDWMSAHLVLGLLAGSLEELTVQAGHEGMPGMTSLAWMAALGTLKSMNLTYDSHQVIATCTDFPPALESLTLCPARYGGAYLHSVPAGLTKCTRLRELALSRLFMNYGVEEDEAPAGDDSSDSGAGDGGKPPHSLALLCRLTSLERLAMCDSLMLPRLPAEFSCLGRLTSLDISDCNWNNEGSVLDPLAALSKLQELNLSRCLLVDLPAPVAELPSLRRLMLRRNRLEFLPEEGGPYLQHLEELDLRRNELTAVPRVLLGCSKLKRLDLASRLCAGKMRFDARDLRRLMSNNPDLRELCLSTEARLSARQMEQLASSFPRVRIVGVDPEDEARSSSEPDSSDEDFAYCGSGEGELCSDSWWTTSSEDDKDDESEDDDDEESSGGGGPPYAEYSTERSGSSGSDDGSD